jgi:phage terminase large subunit-like protein
MTCAERLRKSWSALSPRERPQFLASLNEEETETFNLFWEFFIHGHQTPPPGDWTTWLLIGGRGAGKTRSGAEWVRNVAQGNEKLGIRPLTPIALIGETEHDAREVKLRG